MPSLSANILLVEDNQLDVLAFKRGLSKNNVTGSLFVAENGEVALDILRGRNGQPSLPHPYLIFLDLNMPVMNGLEFLEELRDDDRLKSSVVFILTTSDHEEDVLCAYRKQVAGYLLKQNLGDCNVRLAELVNAYRRVVELPKD